MTAQPTLAALLATAVERNAQDLHLTAGAPPSLRIDGELVRLAGAPLRPEDVLAVVQPALTPLQQQTFDRERDLDFAWHDEKLGRFRCNLYQQRGSLSLTARRIFETIPTAKELGLPAFLGEAALKPQGLVLIVGPNGHGKSTTLAWMVDHINEKRRANIVTIEDPIEHHHAHKLSNVNQREVGTDTRSFAEGLHRVVRQNPDVIVIGELRDHDSIATALSAAETGHLVLGTLHTVNATATIERLLDFFPGGDQGHARTQLAETLLLVFSQRLVPRASGTGRVLAWEKVAASSRVKAAIRDGRIAQLRVLMSAAHDDLVPLDRNLGDLLGHGAIAHDEALRWAESPGFVEEVAARARDATRAAREGARAS